MKGLLIKDFKLLKTQRNFYLLIAAVAVGMAAYLENTAIISSYLGFIGSMFSLSSISYDEFDNGNPFLFSLPISKREYVLEKYGFGLILGGGFWLLGTIIAIMAPLFKQTRPPMDILLECLAILPIMLLFLAVMLPFQLKFGGEKGRIALLGVIGILLLCGTLWGKLAETQTLNLDSFLEHLHGDRMLAAILILCIAALLLSCRISISIMKRKEF